MFYKSVLRILRRETNPCLKLTEVRNVLESLQYFMVPYWVQLMRRLGIQATFDKSLKDVCYIVLSNAILNFPRV